MFENLVAGSLEPELLKLLTAAKKALAGVKDRLETQQRGADLGIAMVAHIQLGALEAWAPAIDDMIASLTPKLAAPTPHDFSGHGH